VSYASEAAAATRTPQSILTVGVPYCANWYAQVINQQIFTPVNFDHVAWTKSGGTTVTPDTADGPDGGSSGLLADTLAFAAAGDTIMTQAIFNPTAPSNAFTGSVWLKAAAPGTITIDVHDTGAGEVGTLQVSLTTEWQRFWVHKLFTGGAAASKPWFRIRRQAGDLASVYAWGANLSNNPGDEDRPLKFPTSLVLTTNVSTCAATDAGDGARCTYTVPGCQDLVHYNKGNEYEPTADLRGIREFKFCMKDAPLPFKGGSIVPSLDSFTQNPQEIDPRRGITQPEKVTYQLSDDSEPGVWDLEKQGQGALVNTARGGGTFWRRFMPRHKNYSNPRGYARLAVGYVAAGMTEADYQQRMSGPILNVHLGSRGRVTLTATDGLDNLKKKIPTKVSSSNLITNALPAAMTTCRVLNAYEVDEPPAGGEYKVTLEIEPDTVRAEKVNVTARTLGTGDLTIERGRWGTTAVDHPSNSPFRAVVEFGTEQTTPSSPVLGIGVDDCLIELLRRADVPAARINSATIADEIATWLPAFIDPAIGTQEGVFLRRTVTEPISISDLVFKESELCDSVLMWVWEDEDQLITCKVFAPLRPTETAFQLTDASHFVADSVEVEDDNDARLSRVVYGFDLRDGEDGRDLEDYLQQDGVILNDEESPGFYGAERTKIIMSKWLSGFTLGVGASVAGRIANRFRSGVRLVTGSLEAKDDSNVRLGAFVKVTTDLIQEPDGTTVVDRIMQVTKKEHLDRASGRIRVSLADTGLFGRFWFWSSAADALPDYDVASDADRLYAYWADSNGKVGAAFDPPYRWW
jgi:hypothetical protein